MVSGQFLPILFKVLFCFVLLNMVVNFILYLLQRKRMNKLLSAFWPAVLLVFVLQSIYQTNPFEISLAYSATFITMTIFSMIGFEATGRVFPLKRYLLFYATTFPLMLGLHKLGFGFTVYTMPFAIATGIPLAHTAIYLLIIDRKTTTRLQKLLGSIFAFMPIHCINFALFRMEEGAQIWGWLVAYALYDTLAILLPSIALEEANLHENERLQRLVQEKTVKLSTSLKENDGLLKVLIHDITNPLMVMKYYLEKNLTESEIQDPAILKVNKSLLAIEEIINQVKSRYMLQKGLKIPLKPVSLDECVNEVSFIFAQSLEKKKISLKFNNHLPQETKVLADKASLTHSVLSNLVSNGLKFSAPESEIEITAREKEGTVYLEIKDKGPGIPKEVIDHLLSGSHVTSTEGTGGEVGTGFGLSIAKNFVHSYGGEMEFESRSHQHFPHNHGTEIRISLDRA